MALPTLSGWKSLNGKSFDFEGKHIKVSEFKAGFEENNKHFDSKIVFLVNENRIVVHSYNSTQNMKVEGKGYSYFIEEFLEPIFTKNVSNLHQRIEKCNRKIIKDLGKSQVKRTTRYKPVSDFKCKQAGAELCQEVIVEDRS